MVCFLVLGLSLIGCPIESSDDDDDDYKVGDMVIRNLCHSSVYDELYEVELFIYGYSTIEGIDYGHEFKNDLKLYLNDEEIELYLVRYSYSRSDKEVVFFLNLCFETPTITSGTNYKVKIVYTASPDRPIYDNGLSTREILDSFEIEKNLTAE